jgi:16S rRNA (cytidine1402-2'-O)-methyltransferase
MIKLGILYIVGTPIGNLEDITLRAIKTLQTVDLIAAEDTRHTGKLLQHFQITTPQISYHEHNRISRQTELLNYLTEGKSIALVTDAGMPGISDPGYDLIKSCIDAKITVMPIPGVTAVITALAASGLPTDRFVFEGFLPTKAKERDDRLASLIQETRTMIFYESPHRLQETLIDFVKNFGENRFIVLGRELTKLYEEFWRGTLKEARELYNKDKSPKGEFTLVLAGYQEEEIIHLSDEEIKVELRQILNQGISRSQASRQLAHQTHLPRRKLYKLALEINLNE